MSTALPSNPYLDKRGEIEIDESDVLPHWYQEGKIQSVTFRLADALPQSKVQELRELRERFVKQHPQPWDDDVRREYYRYISPYENRMIDSGYGSCVLKEQSLRQKLVEIFNEHHNGQIEVIAYVIMPNHVHLLALVNSEDILERVIVRAKRISGFYINKYRGTSGKIWMNSYYDRIVRNADGLKHAVQYILNNPRYLPPSDYTLYLNSTLVDRYGNWLA